jgi:hypothetical protein
MGVLKSSHEALHVCLKAPMRPSSVHRRGQGSFNQSCESRRQKNSTCTRPSFREIWKVSSLSLSLSLSGKKGSAEPTIQFSENPPRRERALDRCSRLETPPPIFHFNLLACRSMNMKVHQTLVWLNLLSFRTRLSRTNNRFTISCKSQHTALPFWLYHTSVPTVPAVTAWECENW